MDKVQKDKTNNNVASQLTEPPRSVMNEQLDNDNTEQ